MTKIPKNAKPDHISAGQVRAAMALLDWTQLQTGYKAGLSVPTIIRACQGNGLAQVSSETSDALIQAFRQAGLEMIQADRKGGRGMRWRLLMGPVA